MSVLLTLIPLLAHAEDATEAARVDGAHIQRPNWSPDGTKLSWEANFHDRKEVTLHIGPPTGPFQRVLPPGGGRTALTAGFATARVGGRVAHELSFSPTELGAYVYAAANDAADYDLYVSGGGALAAAPGADGAPAWSPDGRWIVFTSARSGEGDLYLVEVQRVEAPPRRLTSAPSSSELWARWSPDSSEIAYVGHSESGDNLWRVRMDGAAPQQITQWSGNQVRPTWSPDGQTLAFYANREDPGRFDLYVVEARAGAAPLRLATGVVPDAQGPSWLPDGRHLVAVLDDDDAFDPVALVSLGGGAPRTLALGTVGHGDLDVVAREGGAWLAFTAQGREGDPERTYRRLFVAPIVP